MVVNAGFETGRWWAVGARTGIGLQNRGMIFCVVVSMNVANGGVSPGLLTM